MNLLDGPFDPPRREASDIVDMPIMSWPAPTAADMAAQGDPRVTGGRYRDSYWCQEYTVTAVYLHHGVIWLTCKWADGDVTTHCTAWDSRDVIVSQPA